MDDLRPALVISGTPASGKDAITDSLSVETDVLNGWAFSILKKDKLVDDIESAAQEPRNRPYNLVDIHTFSNKIRSGDYIQHHQRYGKGYAVSRQELERMWRQKQIPVIHNGKQENLAAFQHSELMCFHVLLLCSRDATLVRLQKRHCDDSQECARRLTAYDEERRELAGLLVTGGPLHIHIAVATDAVSPVIASSWIAEAAKNYWRSAQE